MQEDLTMKIEDLLMLKEVQEIITNKDEFIQILNDLEKEEGVVKVNDKNLTVVLTDKFMLYSLINVPNKVTQDHMIELLGLKEGTYTRLYKQSLFWYLVSENEELNNSIDKKLKDIQFEDGTKLKYEISSSNVLKRQILKKIHNYVYQRETNELKASAGSPENIRKDSRGEKISLSTLSNSNREAGSWRKKSDWSASSGKEDSYRKGSNYQNQKVTSFNTKFARRSRFNSDSHEHNGFKQPMLEETNSAEYQEVKINPEQVKYSLKIDHSYSIKEMFDFYDQEKKRGFFDKLPEFENFNEEVINENPKYLTSPFKRFSPFKRDRAVSSNDTFDIQSKLGGKKEEKSYQEKSNQEKLSIPKNNPLQSMTLNK